MWILILILCVAIGFFIIKRNVDKETTSNISYYLKLIFILIGILVLIALWQLSKS